MVAVGDEDHFTFLRSFVSLLREFEFMFATETILTPVQAENVWQVLIDYDHWPAWNPIIKKIVLEGAFRKGAIGWIYYRTGWKTRFTVSQFEPGLSYTLSFKNLLANVHIRRYLGYHNHKTTVTHQVWAEGVLSDIWWVLFSTFWIKMLTTETKKLKEIFDQYCGQPGYSPPC